MNRREVSGDTDNSHNKTPSRKRRVIAAITVAGLAMSACSASPSTKSASVARPNTAKPTVTPTTEAPTTTTTTLPPEVLYPSSEFLGAMQLVRTGPDETNSTNSGDQTVTHRLNNGIWTSTPFGEAPDPNSMYGDGFVYNQNSALFGTIGKTSLVSGHDVTPIDAPVTLNGVNSDQSEVTHSMEARPDPNNPSGGIGNLELGDQFVVTINLPDNQEKVFTYTIDNRYIISQSDSAAKEAMADPPSNPNVSQLTYYDCWEPYTKTYYEVFNADLTSPPTTTSGNVSYTGANSPITNQSLSG